MLALALLLVAAAPLAQDGEPWSRGAGPWRGRGPVAGPEHPGPRADAPVPPSAVPPQRRGDQWRAFEQRREGRILPLREIENRVVPGMRGAEYIGFDFDPGGGIYTLKFLRNGTVVWVEVDGRSGQVLGRTRG